MLNNNYADSQTNLNLNFSFLHQHSMSTQRTHILNDINEEDK